MSRRFKIMTVLGCVAAALLVRAAVSVAGEFVVIRDVPYVAREGHELLADIYVPHGEGPFPGVLIVHGGGWRSGNKTRLARFGEKLAAEGYTAVAINYRLAPEHLFPAQIDDCKSAVRFMRKNAAKYKADGAHLGALGYSAGGHLVALLGVTDPSNGLEGPDADGTSTRLQCFVAGGAPCDFRHTPPVTDLSFWLGGTRAEKPEVYELASPISFVTKDDPPAFFFHGDADVLVPIFGARRMVGKLTEVGVPAELYAIPGAGHGQAAVNPAAADKAVKFFDEHLKNGAKQAAVK